MLRQSPPSDGQQGIDERNIVDRQQGAALRVHLGAAPVFHCDTAALLLVMLGGPVGRHVRIVERKLTHVLQREAYGLEPRVREDKQKSIDAKLLSLVLCGSYFFIAVVKFQANVLPDY